jgi:H/ACA ribonucleoprotein complex subunit 3
MKHLLRKCLVCKIYTLKSQCPHCSSLTVDPTPAKFSPEDKYILYRLPESYNKDETNQEKDLI